MADYGGTEVGHTIGRRVARISPVELGERAKNNTRRSRWAMVNNMSDRKGTVYEQDENGCCHDDRDFW